MKSENFWILSHKLLHIYILYMEPIYIYTESIFELFLQKYTTQMTEVVSPETRIIKSDEVRVHK